ncbi:hypothetical protein ACK6UP_24080, partial [Escherichia coli]
ARVDDLPVSISAVLMAEACNIGLEPLIRSNVPALTRHGTVAKLAMRQPFVLFKGLTFQKLCLPGAFRPGDHHNK